MSDECRTPIDVMLPTQNDLKRMRERADSHAHDKELDIHAPGAKDDRYKVLDGFARALNEIGLVGTFGAEKYSDNGWMEVESGVSRYNDAMLRHHFADARGELLDRDSGLRHLAHQAWNALAILELELRKVVD